MITDWIGRQEVLLPINHENYNFREKEKESSYKKGENLHWNTDKGGLHILRLLAKHKRQRAHTHTLLQLWMWLVDLNYIFECDWLIKLSDNKLSNNKLSNNRLSDNNLASELVENRTFFKPIISEEIVIFMINWFKLQIWMWLVYSAVR